MAGRDGKIVYYVGCFANYYDPEIGKALVQVLRQQGFEVLVPPQKCCGLPMMAIGNAKGARKNAEYNIKSLSKAAKQGYDIVTTCPSCNLMLKREYLHLRDGDDARFVSERLYNIEEYLMKLRREGKLDTNFKPMPISILYHSPCHLKVQGVIAEPIELLKLIPGLSIKRVNTVCCGMGGSYGMKKPNYELSLEIGGKVFAETKAAQVDKVVTECGGCRLQIEAGTGVKAIHPIILLHEAYKAS